MIKTGLENYYSIKNNRKMRFGYTTGSCAAAAAKAAARLLLTGKTSAEETLLTPKGIELHLEILHSLLEKDMAVCAVKKDAGDDPDVTNGLEIFAKVEKSAAGGIRIDGGIGVGRVTKKGLEQAVGSAAINQVPRRMIEQEVESVCEENGYDGGLSVTIYVPEGENVARRTFNPRLGIEGGISILGTSGIVEPMSEAALVKSIEVEMRQKVENGAKYLLITPGNYGADFLKSQRELPQTESMKCSNYVGETLDLALEMGVEGILFVAHIGKFIKVAGGIMNTHSRNADARAELMAANAVRAGCSLECVREILNTVTTEEALTLIKREHRLPQFMREVTGRIEEYLHHRTYQRMMLGAVLFSNEHGYLGETKDVPELIRRITKQERGGQ